MTRTGRPHPARPETNTPARSGPRRRHTAAAAALALALALTAAGDAHELPRERTMLVELSESSAEAMVVYQEPPGRRISLLFARYDLDGDENIDGPEAEAASSSWIPYALQGLEFRIAGETPERLSEEIKFRPEHNGALSAAIYLEWDVDDLDPGQSRAFTVSRKSDAADFETLVRFQLKSGLELTDAPSSRVTRETGPYRLPPGRSISVSATNTNTHDLPTRPP